MLFEGEISLYLHPPLRSGISYTFAAAPERWGDEECRVNTGEGFVEGGDLGLGLRIGWFRGCLEGRWGVCWGGSEEMDFVLGIYAHWLRYGMVYWNQAGVARRVDYGAVEYIKRGSLLKGG